MVLCFDRPPRAKRTLGADDPAAFDTEGLAVAWSIGDVHKPWKNPYWSRDTSKRTKNIKQVLGLERERTQTCPPGPSRCPPQLAPPPQDPAAEAALPPEEQEKALAARQAQNTAGKPVIPMANCRSSPVVPFPNLTQ